MDIITILLQYGLAGLAVYLMYKLMANHSKHLTRIITENLRELREEIKKLREILEELVRA